MVSSSHGACTSMLAKRCCSFYIDLALWVFSSVQLVAEGALVSYRSCREPNGAKYTVIEASANLLWIRKVQNRVSSGVTESST